MVNIQQNVTDGANFYKMFREGTLDYTNSTHKAWLDEYYNQLMNAPDLEVFNRLYVAYLRTYHSYEMRMSYGAVQSSI